MRGQPKGSIGHAQRHVDRWVRAEDEKGAVAVEQWFPDGVL